MRKTPKELFRQRLMEDAKFEIVKPGEKRRSTSRRRRTNIKAPGAGKRGARPLTIARKARKAIEEKKGRDIIILDVRKASSVTDYFLLASGHNPPHLKAMAGEVHHKLKQDGIMCCHWEGTPESGWVVLDYIDVVIHIMLDDTRRYYAIEELWSEAPRAE